MKTIGISNFIKKQKEQTEVSSFREKQYLKQTRKNRKKVFNSVSLTVVVGGWLCENCWSIFLFTTRGIESPNDSAGIPF